MVHDGQRRKSTQVSIVHQVQLEITLSTAGQGLYPFTAEAVDFVAKSRIVTGLFTAFIRHTSASLLIQENADQNVLRDLDEFFRRLVPEDTPWFRHRDEGPDDMPAHIKSALTQSSLSIPVAEGRLALGTWQGLFVFEHRSAPHRRKVVLYLAGG
jgi:secondary thiamine-phosphate synthase enzyme